jgi:hypothetical protein
MISAKVTVSLFLTTIALCGAAVVFNLPPPWDHVFGILAGLTFLSVAVTIGLLAAFAFAGRRP